VTVGHRSVAPLQPVCDVRQSLGNLRQPFDDGNVANERRGFAALSLSHNDAELPNDFPFVPKGAHADIAAWVPEFLNGFFGRGISAITWDWGFGKFVVFFS
jgi:hypothetical protein